MSNDKNSRRVHVGWQNFSYIEIRTSGKKERENERNRETKIVILLTLIKGNKQWDIT